MVNLPIQSIRNVVVVGETGVGKSSLINLVTGKELAKAASGVCGVTTKTEFYDWKNDSGQTFRLWDTPGLNEGTNGSVSPRQARDAIRVLLTEQVKGDGTHLLVLCMRGLSTVTKGMEDIYKQIRQIRDEISRDIPLVAVVTELEKISAKNDIFRSMDKWWTDNIGGLSEHHMLFSGHACVTNLPDSSHPILPGRQELCRRIVRQLIVEGASPKPVRNVIIVGKAGAGKSSLINLALDSERAVVSNHDSPTTTTASSFDWETDHQTFRLWDTPGFGEGLDDDGKRRAQGSLRSLFMHLRERGDIHLLVMCIRGGSAITKETHNLIMEIRNEYSAAIPVVAVITGLKDSTTTSMEAWWADSSRKLTDHDMAFSGYACIRALPDNPQFHERRKSYRDLVRKLIVDKSLPSQITPLHVLLFGETGVGKSSLINLLAGRRIASVSPDAMPCTLDSQEYQFHLGSTPILLWDTVGLEEPEKKGPNGYIGAIEKAVQLIRRLNAAGGISLLIFCIRGSRITTTTQSNYRLFFEILGKEKVPIALAVTHLEKETDMENWWRRNVRALEKHGILSAGHACVTGLEGDAKYAKSKEILEHLLSRFDNRGKFSMPPDDWIVSILKGLSLLMNVFLPKKDLVRTLTKRCSMELELAQRVAACIGDAGSG